MLEGHYAPRPPRMQPSAATATIKRSVSRRLQVGASPSDDHDVLLDLSSRGLKIRGVGAAPEQGARLDVELRHPSLRGPIKLAGQVKWISEDPHGADDAATWRAGVEFELVRDTTSVALVQLITLELGSTIYGRRGPVGYVAPAGGPRPSEATVYGLDRHFLGTIAREATFVLTLDAGDTSEHGSLETALAELFPGHPRLRVAPPVRLTPPPAGAEPGAPSGA